MDVRAWVGVSAHVLDKRWKSKQANVEFRVVIDERIQYRSDVMKARDKAKRVDVDVTKTLILEVSDDGDGNTFDHAVNAHGIVLLRVKRP